MFRRITVTGGDVGTARVYTMWSRVSSTAATATAAASTATARWGM